jgi:hypothetical protein
MRFEASLVLLLPLAAFAQTAPPEVDQALRSRVNEFFQAHVDANYRRAFELVAEDTKDYYFATEKVRFKSFKVGDIKYNDDFTDAVVDVLGQREMRMRFDFPVVVEPVPMKSHWKIENGKWCFYDHNRLTWITAMGPSDLDKLKPQNPDGAAPKGPDLSDKSIAAMAQQIVQQSSIDKNELTLPLNKPTTEQVTFHNGQQGMIKLALQDGVKPAGLTVTLDKNEVNAGENAVIKVHFEPPADLVAGAIPANFTVRLIMDPFSIQFPITIKFAAPAQPARQ